MRIITVVGGVISGVGKGVAASSIGKILQEYGYSVTIVKIDPYINFDAGTLRPTEHGEVWVTDDGGEIDQDLGNYERFLGYEIPKKNNITTGQIYKELIDRERRGEFLGQTVQFIPHVPNEIKRRIRECEKFDNNKYDFVIVEIGGTIGDYENLPYLFAMKSFEVELGKENVAHILVSYLPVPDNIGEMKTKPTQQAIKMMIEHGITPDFVLCRSIKPLDDVRKKKIETYANIPIEHIISAPDVKSIYLVPLNFEKENLGEKILKRFNLKPKKTPDWTRWKTLVDRIENPKRTIKIAMVGKYVDTGDFCLPDSYISINQSLEHAGAELDLKVNIEWIDAKLFEKNSEELKRLNNYDGIIVPGGFGASGVEGKISTIKFARENKIPYLGLCYGMQLAVVEYARNVCGLKDAHTTEVEPNTKNPVVDILPTQKKILELSEYGGTMRLGAYAAILKKDTKVFELYKNRLEYDKEKIEKFKNSGQEFRLGILNPNDIVIFERHRHRYEVNPKYIELLEKNGLVFSGYHHRLDSTKLMEFIELPNHPFFIGTQAHPEFNSKFGNASPLFLGFVKACCRI
ncbi:MAG: CTP synthase (glutamine hydrolyzing) [Candidatus Aenigmatarchaeota archaeon]